MGTLRAVFGRSKQILAMGRHRFTRTPPAPTLEDGYYYQFDITDPRTATGWNAGPLLHDGNGGTYYLSDPFIVAQRIAVLVASAAGMTIDQITGTFGYQYDPTPGAVYGSNDLVSWDLLAFAQTAIMPSSNGILVWGNGYNQNNQGNPLGPYKYIATTFIDVAGGGNTARAGCAEINLKRLGNPVGP